MFDDTEKVELFNNFFCEQSNLDDQHHSPPVLEDLHTEGLSQIHLSVNEVEDILNVLDTSKATGPDKINPKLLKEGAPILKNPLCRLFNISLEI